MLQVRRTNLQLPFQREHANMDSTQTMAKDSLELEKGLPPRQEIVDIDVDIDEPPDGGLDAWMTVAASFLASFMAFGTGAQIYHSSCTAVLRCCCRKYLGCLPGCIHNKPRVTFPQRRPLQDRLCGRYSDGLRLRCRPVWKRPRHPLRHTSTCTPRGAHDVGSTTARIISNSVLAASAFTGHNVWV